MLSSFLRTLPFKFHQLLVRLQKSSMTKQLYSESNLFTTVDQTTRNIPSKLSPANKDCLSRVLHCDKTIQAFKNTREIKKKHSPEATLSSCSKMPAVFYLRKRKHVPCFYRVIQTRVEVWENEKCCGNTSRRRLFPQLFRVLPNFHKCLYNSIETRNTCFLFLLENTATRKRKTTC